jgi:hypothetical protein
VAQSNSDLAAEFEPRPTLAEHLRPATIERLKYVFEQMDFDGNHSVTWEEAEAFFIIFFVELPREALELNNRVGTESASEAAALRRNVSREQSAALFADVDANKDQMIAIDEFICVWGKVKALGYSEREILNGLTSALEHGAWRQWQAQALSPAWETPPMSIAASQRESSPIAMLPEVATSAVLPLQELPELDTSDADEGELDESAAREWRRLWLEGPSSLRSSSLGGGHRLIVRE